MSTHLASRRSYPLLRTLAGVAALLISLLLGLATARIAFEGLFPRWPWLSRFVPVTLVAMSIAVWGGLLWFRLARHHPPGTALAPFLPFLLNAVYLFEPSVALVTSRFLFAASLWLAALFLAGIFAKPGAWPWLGFAFLSALLLPIYLLTMGRTVGTADAFEFQVVVPKLGIVHPTGYPLYLLLTRLFTFIPFNSVAWRVNLASAIYGLLATWLLFALLWKLTDRPLPSMLAALLFGLTPTFWSQAVEAEVYTLHAAIVAAALLLMRGIGNWSLAGKRSPEVDRWDNLEDDRRDGWAGWRPFILTLLLARVLGLGQPPDYGDTNCSGRADCLIRRPFRSLPSFAGKELPIFGPGLGCFLATLAPVRLSANTLGRGQWRTNGIQSLCRLDCRRPFQGCTATWSLA
jgi:hypothetical protein